MEHSREWARQIFQVVCLVDNLDAALENWTNMVEFDESSLRRGRTESCFRGGEERPCLTRYARFDLGGAELRLVEPVDKAGDDPYAVCLREKGPGFHHLGIYTEHPAELTARYEEMGLHPAFREQVEGVNCAVYDFTEQIGLSLVLWDHMTGPCARLHEFNRKKEESSNESIGV